MNRYIVFFCEDNQKYGVVRSDAAMYSKREDAEDRADFMSMKSAAASSLGGIRTEKKSMSSRENGKKGGRPKNVDNLLTSVDK